MQKFNIIGNGENKPRFSSNIIISNLNEAARRQGLFSEDGIKICYDSCCNSPETGIRAFISSYEIDFPEIILNNAGGRPIIAVGRDNQRFIINGHYPENFTDFFSLGVDSELFSVINKEKELDKFNYSVYTESLVRGGIELVIECFGLLYEGKDKDHYCLKIEDRNGTSRFFEYVHQRAKYYNINVEYINDHWNVGQVKEFFKTIDVNIYVSRSSTFALPPLEALSMTIPSIILDYAGPRDYVIHGFNALCPKYDLNYVKNELQDLINQGQRNFFFPLNGRETWAITRKESLMNCMLTIEQNKELREKLGKNGRLTAKSMTWDRSATQLGTLLDRWF